MVQTNSYPAHLRSPVACVRVFTPLLRVLWTFAAILTVFLEVIPAPLVAPVPFYAYCGLKGLLFFLVGYLAPFAFWRFNALNRGIIFAGASASFVETLQGVLGHGHSFHWYELVLKLILILVAFIWALEARHDRQITLGPVRIGLVGEHLQS